MKAIETTGHIDKPGLLRLDEKIKLDKKQKVKVILLIDDEDDITDAMWLKGITKNQAFAFLNDKSEDIYSLTDGKPVSK